MLLTRIQDQESAPPPTTGHSLTSIDHFALYFGGASHEEGVSSQLYRLDYASWTWSKILSEGPCARHEHGAALIKYQKKPHLFIFGGVSDTELLHDCWLFDWSKRLSINPVAIHQWTAWETKGKRPSPRTIHSMVNSDSRIYVFGGGEAQMAAVNDDSMYILDVGKTKMSLFCLEKEGWIQLQLKNAPSPRLGHSMTLLNGTLYLFGGMNEGKLYNDLYSFDIGNPKGGS
jgi:N-acetylneuraminic acid mutarotase